MSYHDTHDHLGNPVPPVQAPMRISDFVICTFCLVAIVALASGGLA